jgi:hypothetical protein
MIQRLSLLPLLVALVGCDGGFTNRITALSAERLDGGGLSVAVSVVCELHGLDHCLSCRRVVLGRPQTDAGLADGGAECGPSLTDTLECQYEFIDTCGEDLRGGQSASFEVRSSKPLPPGPVGVWVSAGTYLGLEASASERLLLVP